MQGYSRPNRECAAGDDDLVVHLAVPFALNDDVIALFYVIFARACYERHLSHGGHAVLERPRSVDRGLQTVDHRAIVALERRRGVPWYSDRNRIGIYACNYSS